MLTERSLTIGHLYPDLMNLYADRGNVFCLAKRCNWRGIEAEVIPIGLGVKFDPAGIDILFIGGGQDKEQKAVAKDLLALKGPGIRAAVEEGMVALAICGGFQLFGQYYRPAEGKELTGIGVFDAWTIHKGARTPRCIGNVVVEWEDKTLVGFENHGGLTYLAGRTSPLGKVIKGFGNNAEDRSEGAQYRNAFGTYLHGPVLPKNPYFADHLINLALLRKYGNIGLQNLDDSIEMAAHEVAIRVTERS